MEIMGWIAMLFVGATLGLIGGGGAILTVPIMVYLFKIQPVIATSYSLFIVGVSSLFGVWRYHQKKLVDYKIAAIFAIPSFIGTYFARRELMPRIPNLIFQFDTTSLTKDQLVMAVFAIVMVAASTSMIRRDSGSPAMAATMSQNKKILALLGFSVGFVAGFVGAGGGFLIIPSLVVIAGMPITMAIGTSLLIISANSLVGFSGDLLAATDVSWSFLTKATGVALLGILAGSYASQFVPAAKLKSAFGWFVLSMGCYILLTQLRR